MKRILYVVAAVVLLPILALVGVLALTFSGIRGLVDGTELPGGTRLVKDGHVALYVLPAGDKELALIDCGDDAKGASVLTELRRRGLGPEAVKGIFLTHGHPDHLGACHLFASAAVFAFAADVPLVAGTQASKGPITWMMKTPLQKRVQVTHELRDGEVVTIGPLSVKAFAMPGHTAGSASFLANGTLFMGDNASGASDGSLRGPPWVFSDDVAQGRRSLQRLAQQLQGDSMEVKAVAFGHSGPLEGLDALRQGPR